jgi:hypothetical protein
LLLPCDRRALDWRPCVENVSLVAGRAAPAHRAVVRVAPAVRADAAACAEMRTARHQRLPLSRRSCRAVAGVEARFAASSARSALMQLAIGVCGSPPGGFAQLSRSSNSRGFWGWSRFGQTGAQPVLRFRAIRFDRRDGRRRAMLVSCGGVLAGRRSRRRENRPSRPRLCVALQHRGALRRSGDAGSRCRPSCRSRG